MRRHCVLDEGANLVRVWMVTGLERLAHVGSGVAIRPLLFGERGGLRSLQQPAQVYFDVARVSSQRLLRCSFAQSDRNQVGNQLFAKIASEAFEPAADGGFMDVESSCDLEKGLPVEVIGGEQEPVFRIQA